MCGTAQTAKQGISRTPTSAVNFFQVFLLTSMVWMAFFNGGSAMCAMAPEYEAEQLAWETERAKKLQQSAPVVVDIEILGVHPQPPSLESRKAEIRVATFFSVEARVTHVERSTLGIKPQDRLLINYQIWEYGDGATGGMIHNPIVVKAGDKVRAYLQTSPQPLDGPQSFVIAAEILSFEPCSPADQSLFRQLKNWWSS